MSSIEGNGWSRYEKLVLTQLEDLKHSQKDLQKDVIKLSTETALIHQKLSETHDYEDRIAKLESNQVTQDTIKKERRWIYASVLSVFSAIIFPAIVVGISSGVL